MIRSRLHTGLKALLVVVALTTGMAAMATEASAAGPACTRKAHVGRIVNSAFGPLRCTRVAPGRYRWRAYVAPASTTAPLNLAVEAWASQMLGSVNAQRAAAGERPLLLCGRLMNQAQAHAADQAATGVMSHTGSDGSSLQDRAARSGYLAGANGWKIGENVAYGYSDVPKVMAAWMASPGHRANILDASFVHVGFGRASGTSALFWSQEFGYGGTC
jgi:uncharacterized protein YkwD